MSDDLVGQYMTTELVTFRASEPVAEAVTTLVERDVDGGPVVDDEGRLIGMFSSADVMVQDANLHLPTVVALFGVTVELPLSTARFDRDVRKALASTVGELMHDEPVTIGPDDSVRDAATRMHETGVSRLPVVDDEGRLVGIIARADVLRSLVSGRVEPSDQPE